MTAKQVFGSAVLLLVGAVGARGIDRDAVMVDTLDAEWVSVDGADVVSGNLWGETVLAAENRKWAILFGGGYGQVMPDKGSDFNFWRAGLGLKYYLQSLTSVALAGTYAAYDTDSDADVRAGLLTLKHRLISAKEAISPYLRAGIGVQELTDFEVLADDSVSQFFWLAGVGCDFMLERDLGFVVEGGYFDTEGLSGDDVDAGDGWRVSFGIKGYWN